METGQPAGITGVSVVSIPRRVDFYNLAFRRITVSLRVVTAPDSELELPKENFENIDYAMHTITVCVQRTMYDARWMHINGMIMQCRGMAGRLHRR